MSVKKVLNIKKDISKEMSFCMQKGLKVYPIEIKGKWYVEYTLNGVKKRFDKEITKDKIQESIIKTWLSFYGKFIQKD